MRVLITGAAGFVGQRVAKALLNDENGAYTVTLTDIIEPPIPNGVKWPAKATSVKADLLVDSEKVVEKDHDALFVFHGIMSSGAEADFDLGMRVNFDATRSLLEAVRKTAPGAKFIYTSSGAVYGGGAAEPIVESTRATPETSYGAEKMMCEYLINDYHRRGFIDALIFRLPSVSVRAGKPTAAASSFLSGIIREPMQGKECVVPIKDRSFRHTITTPRTLVSNMLYALTLPRDALPGYDRAINHPGLLVTVQDMLDSLARVGGEDRLQFIREEEDVTTKRILYSWVAAYDNSKALSLGFAQDKSFDDAVREFKEGLESES
ncbi:nucleoside-diphosphate-sugar epimerase [Xylariales sp. PMI_506]|nr:nucleoside-diphosphate-sugar epimerase [Xylariales sp. PMI_506]